MIAIFKILMAALVLLTAPTVEPVTLDEAKQWARIDTSADDVLISDLITEARQYAETVTRRQFCTATWKMSLDSFYTGPVSGAYDDLRLSQPQAIGATPFGSPGYRWLTSIRIPVPPLQSVTSLTYVDTNGVTQTLDPSLYIVDSNSETGRITPAFSTPWPYTRSVINAVNITFVAGYAYNPATPGTPTPPVWWGKIRRAIMMTVASWYNQREAVSEREMREVPGGVESLLIAASYGSYC